ncbi:MAG TPA: flagellar basal body-associated FliL family protein [Fimbriimonadaceae bacterium]|nr:flagellar basal body-associated FliL family protein [Fimbriimonadaceae bacterium]
MAEEKKEKKKSKSKLPILLALVILIAGGGFFVMKRSKAPAAAPVMELGEAVKLDEFLVNLREKGVYLRTDIELQFAKKNADGSAVDAKHYVSDHLGQVRDAIISRLRSKSEAEMASLDGMRKLKREIAADVNKIFHAVHKKDAKAEADAGEEGQEEPKKQEPNPDWDHQEGPVLKINFHSFATQ